MRAEEKKKKNQRQYLVILEVSFQSKPKND